MNQTAWQTCILPQFLNNAPYVMWFKMPEKNVDKRSESSGTFSDLLKVTAELRYGLEAGGTWSLGYHRRVILLTPKLTPAPPPLPPFPSPLLSGLGPRGENWGPGTQ